MTTKEEVLKMLKAKTCIPGGEHIFDHTDEGSICVCGQVYAHWVTMNDGNRLLTIINRLPEFYGR